MKDARNDSESSGNQKVATDTLERKRRLGEYAVVWQDNKPVIIGEMLEDSDDDFRRETSLL